MREVDTDEGALGRARLALLLALGSGISGLAYETLWSREIGLLLGGTARGTSATLSVFFLGLGLGAWYFGRRAHRFASPLRGVATLEAGAALSAGGRWVLGPALSSTSSAAVEMDFGSGALQAAQLALVAPLLMLPAFLTGGTLPLLAQSVGGGPTTLARSGTRLYGVHVVGGTIGAVLAGFLLPRWLGFSGAWLTAMAISACIAIVAASVSAGPPAGAPDRSASPAATPPRFLFLAAFSGAGALGLEVVWTLMFAQVLQNSVYSFALIVGVFLLTLAVGSVLGRAIGTQTARPEMALPFLATAAGVAVGLTPFLFHGVTGGMRFVGADAGFLAYLAAVIGTGLAVMGLPGVLIGAFFPLTFHWARGGRPGAELGRLTAANTFGAVVGSLVVGFVLVDSVGLWRSVQLLAAAYVGLGASCAWAVSGLSRSGRVVPLVGLLALATSLDPSSLPVLPGWEHLPDPKVIREIREDGDGVVAVVDVAADRRMVMDGYYTLGGSLEEAAERDQGRLPLQLHGAPGSVFFLGLGTGITAAAALEFPVRSVVVAERRAAVVALARRHFADLTGDLFEDPRVRMVATDARTRLRYGTARFDVIVGDLFLPWRRGAGGLYASEHFAAVRRRLRPGGLFAQWLPLYQLSREDTLSIVRTFEEAFPGATLWAGTSPADRPLVALVGTEEPGDGGPLCRAGKEPWRCIAELSPARAAFEAAALIGDDWPVIEFRAPVHHRAARVGEAGWFVGEELEAWYADLRRAAAGEGGGP